jgi:hypothetical protein
VFVEIFDSNILRWRQLEPPDESTATILTILPIASILLAVDVMAQKPLKQAATGQHDDCSIYKSHSI